MTWKKWLLEYGVPALALGAAVLFLAWMMKSERSAAEDTFRDNEHRFGRASAWVLDNKRCDTDEERLTKTCWFAVRAWTPGTQCAWSAVGIYKCSVVECVWLKEPVQ